MRKLALALVVLASGAAAQDRPVVATVSYPLAYFAERLGGDAIEVMFNVPEGQDPAFWRPGLVQISEIQSADLIALNGAGFAEWVTKVSLPRSRLVDTSDGFSDGYIQTESITHSHGADGEHSHTGTASYTWLDFGQAAEQAASLAEAMERRLPGLGRIEDRLSDLISDLKSLDREAAEIGEALSGRAILATHPRYQYFARAYGLEIEALDWEAGAMPSEAQWNDLAALAKATDASLLIWEAAPPGQAVTRAEEIGLTSVVFPPLAHSAAEGNFLSIMSTTLEDLSRSDSGR